MRGGGVKFGRSPLPFLCDAFSLGGEPAAFGFKSRPFGCLASFLDLAGLLRPNLCGMPLIALEAKPSGKTDGNEYHGGG